MSPRKSMPIRRNLRSLVSKRTTLELARSCQFLERCRRLLLAGMRPSFSQFFAGSSGLEMWSYLSSHWSASRS